MLSCCVADISVAKCLRETGAEGPQSCVAVTALLAPLFDLYASKYRASSNRSSSSRRCRNPHCDRANLAEHAAAAMKVAELCSAALANLAKNRTSLWSGGKTNACKWPRPVGWCKSPVRPLVIHHTPCRFH